MEPYGQLGNYKYGSSTKAWILVVALSKVQGAQNIY